MIGLGVFMNDWIEIGPMLAISVTLLFNGLYSLEI